MPYFHVVVGLPLTAIGLALSAATAFTMPVAFVTGVLVDRYGARRVVVASQLLQGVGFLAYLAVGSVEALVPAALLATGGQRMFWSAYFTLVAEIAAPKERDRWYGLAGAARNIGLGVGGLLSGMLVGVGGETGYQFLVLANALSFLLAAGLTGAKVREPRRVATRAAGGTGYGTLLRDRPFLGLIAANTVFALCSIMLGVGLPVYAREALGAPPWVIGALFALNTALLALAQTLIVRFIEAYRRTRMMLFAGLVWCAWSVLMAAALAVPPPAVVAYLFAYTVVYTLAELVHAPVSNALAAAASPEPLRGRYLAAFQFSFTVATILAPGLFTLLFAVRPALPWAVVAALAVAAGLATVSMERRLPADAVRSAPRPSPYGMGTEEP